MKLIYVIAFVSTSVFAQYNSQVVEDRYQNTYQNTYQIQKDADEEREKKLNQYQQPAPVKLNNPYGVPKTNGY